ncbi:Branched-chain amino acid transport ATP-binding protein LivF (TC 3.A.1.4.1) [Leucobacter sp. 7(1)]|uniref:ABC transporter ATP-binding protein n=1 Tax=Leucobacter sp. 7(1) TaxID=1255613 RepID=UPI00097E7658|nr:ATP-binding cassette domain-containing protein [Leucobacter sp. 7(1)]SJN08623.1 Branched-chain amino acid transport ATP-binding protein LivF (TC 3.A.1.4.1) [Leucobacter sp. 7(1)]
MVLLEADHLTAGYGDTRAITDVSIEIGEGSVLALVGANGAGKSTLLNVISGAHRPDAGRLIYAGEDVTRESAFLRARRGISLVPEGRRLFASMSVRDNLLTGRGSQRLGPWNLDRVIAALPMLEPLLGRTASKLSGGEQQAVAIGRSLLANPRLLLLDEVSLGLAPIVVDDLYRSLRTVLDSGLSVILVEQDLRRTLTVANHIVCLLEGTLVLQGTPAELSTETITDAYFGHARTGESPHRADGGH